MKTKQQNLNYQYQHHSDQQYQQHQEVTTAQRYLMFYIRPF